MMAGAPNVVPRDFAKHATSTRLVMERRSISICANPRSGVLSVSPVGEVIFTQEECPLITRHANSVSGSFSGKDCARKRNVRRRSGARITNAMAEGVFMRSSGIMSG